MRILHLSDIQEGIFGIKEDLKNQFGEDWNKEYNKILNKLRKIFSKLHDENSVDFIVISGDLVSTGSKEEYELLGKEIIPILEDVYLREKHQVTKERWLVVPGNHDVKWGENDKRFNGFINFCHEHEFNLQFKLNEPNSIFSVIEYEDVKTPNRIKFLLMNSCLEIFDQGTRKKINLSKKKFLNTIESLEEDIPKIMICHHRLHEISYNLDNILENLRDKKVVLALVGDIHKSQSDIDEINYIKCIHAGALLANESVRKTEDEIIPCQFNVYDLDLESGFLSWITYVKLNKWESQNRGKVKLDFGIPIDSPFTSYKDFFKHFLDKDNPFNHLHPLIGQEGILKELNRFVNSERSVAIIHGRGGIGKSKVLYEFCSNFTNRTQWRILFIKSGVDLTIESVNQLPRGKCILIIDDAHQRNDIDILFEIIKMFPDIVKIIISTRPSKIEEINGILNKFNITSTNILKRLKVEELQRSDLKKLAEGILQEKKKYVNLLLKIADKTPFIILIGGKLIYDDLVNPRLLGYNQKFQRIVIDRYKDILFGKVSSQISSEMCGNILSLISILSPIHLYYPKFQEIASNYLEIRLHKFNEYIGILEENEILSSHRGLVKIIPENISNHILYTSCITPQKRSTKYAIEILEKFKNFYFSNIIYNISELNWQIKQNKRGLDLFREIWIKVREVFNISPHSDRVYILKNLRRVIIYQPDKVLSLIEYAYKNPSQIPELKQIYDYSHKDVIQEIPPLIREISYYIFSIGFKNGKKYFLRSCNILWEISKEVGDGEFYPSEKPIDLLISLVKYDLNKSLKFNELVLKCVEKWIKDEYTFDQETTPFDILMVLLRKEERTIKGIKSKIRVTSFVVPYEKTKPIRKKAISILKSNLTSTNLKIVWNSLQNIIEVLYPPSYQLNVGEYEEEFWIEEQNEILDIIDKFIKKNNAPIIMLKIKTELLGLVKRPLSESIKQRVNKIIEDIKENDIKLIRALTNNYYHDWEKENYAEFEKRVNLEIFEFVKELLRDYDNEMNILKLIENELTIIQKYGIQANPKEFLYILGQNDITIAHHICNRILENPNSQMKSYIQSLIRVIRENNIDLSQIIIESIIGLKDKDLSFLIAEGYRMYGWTKNLNSKDFELIENLLELKDTFINQNVIKLFSRISSEFISKAKEILMKSEIENDGNFAEAMAEVLIFDHGLNRKHFNDAELKHLLFKFLKLNRLNSNKYYLQELIGYFFERIPFDTIEFFLKRIEISDDMQVDYKNLYIPIPYEGFHQKLGKSISNHSNYIEILRKIRDTFLDTKVKNHEYISRLFFEVSNQLSSEALDVLKEWIDDPDENKLKVLSGIIRNNSSIFLLKEHGFISEFLVSLKEFDDELYDIINKKLYRDIFYGSFVGSLVHKYEYIKNSAIEISKKYSDSSLANQFYLDLAKRAEEHIKDNLDFENEDNSY